jgi:hypothetical protein
MAGAMMHWYKSASAYWLSYRMSMATLSLQTCSRPSIYKDRYPSFP